jgi:hypothetical protein
VQIKLASLTQITAIYADKTMATLILNYPFLLRKLDRIADNSYLSIDPRRKK